MCVDTKKKIGEDTVQYLNPITVESTPTVEGREQRQLIINKIQLLHIFTII